MPYPYPSEQPGEWWAQFDVEAAAFYARVGRPYPDPPDPACLTWGRRCRFDIGRGMEPDTAKRKHLHGLQEALGLPFDPPAGVLQRRVVQGKFFALADGTLWTMIQCSDFNLLWRYRMQDITPILAQRRDVGFNTLRVFTVYDVAGIGRQGPSPELYGQIPSFLALCATYSLYVELVAFTGPYTGLFADDDAKVAHWEALQEAMDGSVHSLERVNEGDHPANRDIPFSRLHRPTGVLASAGSAMADHAPMLPVWNYSSYHSNDLYEWQRKCAHNPMADVADKYGCPAVAGENTRGDKDGYNLAHAFDAAAGGALLPAGSCCHTPHWKTSELWDGAELDWARAWVQGAQSVPLEFQRGAYKHRTDLEGPGVIRAYGRRLADGREFVVMIRA